jgi:Trypsin-co-occurring domain 2
MPEPEGIPLTDAVSQLRGELERAIVHAEGERLKFEAIDVTMEFQVGVTRTGEGHAGLKFWVLELGGGRSRENATTQTVGLRLKPVLADGRPVAIARETGESPLAGDRTSERKPDGEPPH